MAPNTQPSEQELVSDRLLNVGGQAKYLLTKTLHKTPYPAISATRPELSKAGKTILITGGATGLGFAMARGFAQAAAAKILILGRRAALVDTAVEKLAAEFPQTAFAGLGGVDITNSEAVAKVWADLDVQGTVVDILVLSAGTISPAGGILDFGLEAVWGDYITNVRAQLDLTERFYKQKGRAGRKLNLILISTAAAHDLEPNPWTVYCLTKNAGTMLVQQIARDVKPDDMQINLFHPGLVYTDFVSSQFKPDQFDYESPDLCGHYAVWASSEEAKFLHGRFVWASWDVDELANGPVKEKIENDFLFLRVGINFN